ncbi:MAG: MipA/OmpV family protein [Pseudomonadota bacterium]
MHRKLFVWVMVAMSAGVAADDGPWRIGVATGYGERQNPLILSDDVPIVVDLDIAWFGERWFFDNGDLGVTLHNGDKITSNLVARARSDRLFFSRTDTQLISVSTGTAPTDPLDPDDVAEILEVPDRDFAIEVGFEFLTDGDWGFMQFAVFQDVAGVHDGFEVAAEYGIGQVWNRWYVETAFRATYKSEQLNDYYWGIRSSEASAVLPEYTAADGVNFGVSLGAAYHLTERWALRFGIDLEYLNDAVRDSPVVDDNQVAAYFAGLSVSF